MVIVAGRAPMACTLCDLSEGGALLECDASLEGVRSFRLTIEGTDLEALCEARHVRGRQVGVRFVRPADGAAIYNHFQAAVVTPAVRAPIVVKVMPRLDMGALRRDCLDSAMSAITSRFVGFRVRRVTRMQRCTGLVQAAALAMALNSRVLTRKQATVADCGAEHQDVLRAA
jgi:hypothetical protein